MQHYSRSSQQAINPIHDLMELNFRTLESLSFVNPMDLTKINRPETLLEKNIDVLVNNSHKLLDYMHQVFLIGESHLLNASHKLERSTKSALNKSQGISMQAIDSTIKTSQKIGQKMQGSSSKRTSKSSKRPSLSASSARSSSSRSGRSTAKRSASRSTISSKGRRTH